MQLFVRQEKNSAYSPEEICLVFGETHSQNVATKKLVKRFGLSWVRFSSKTKICEINNTNFAKQGLYSEQTLFNSDIKHSGTIS